MKIAMTDLDIVWEDKEKNKEICRRMIQEAAGENADLILFPELTLTGFSMNLEKITDAAQETAEFFSALARTHRIAIGFGYATIHETRGRNHFCLVDADGTVLADYEKLHPFTYGGETKVFDGGDRICHAKLNGFTCGMFVCYDLRFPECFQKLPKDTDAVFLIANWPESRADHWYTLLKARAIELSCYVVGINRTGTGGGLQYGKSSVAYGMDGGRLPEKQGVLNRYVELAYDAGKKYRESFPVRQDRRRGIDYV